MSRRLALLAFALLIGWSTVASAQPHRTWPPAIQTGQEKPIIHLVTMGIGSLMWERHGHIALCVETDNPRNDVCYNYGIGDFQKPVGMAWGFFRGTKSFWVGKQRPRDMLWIYENADRTIWVQPLPLTAEQKAAVIAKLELDVLEENKHYAYDHFWDNCTTRVRDVLDKATGGALSSMTEKTDGRTFRDLAREGFLGMRAALIITDIGMGRVTDRVPTYWERMFLPDYLREAAATRWGVKPVTLYERKGPPPLTEGPSGRIVFALLILVLTAPAWITRLVGRFERLGLAIAIVPPSLLGLVHWGLAIVSPLPYVEMNESCLVFIPLDLLVLFLGPEKRRLYARGRVAMLGLCALLMLVGVLTQPLLAPLLWPLIPLAVVAFWPERVRAVVSPSAAATPPKAIATPRQRTERRS